MIKSFADHDTERFFQDIRVARFESIERRGRIKLHIVHAATSLDSLRVPPGNRLETLKGDRDGQRSIRINEQWRICFVWRDGHAYDVEICDYH